MQLSIDFFPVNRSPSPVRPFLDHFVSSPRSWYTPFDADRATDIVLSLFASCEWVSDFDIFDATCMHPGDVTCFLQCRLVATGCLEVRHCYFGSDSPGDPDYYGYRLEYRLMDLPS